METIQDVVIIGGGPAGSTAATLLARKGYKGLPKNKLFQEKQETGFLNNDNHF